MQFKFNDFFYASCANAGDGQKYMPNEEAFGYYCYEADTGFYAAGTAEKLVDEYLDMLQKLKNGETETAGVVIDTDTE